MKRHHALAPIAAAMALALCGTAAATTPSSAVVLQQTTTSQNTSQNTNQNNQDNNNQSDNQGNMATRNMSPKAKSAYREGELWATYVVNPVLQSYKIDADVQGHTATLSGTVATHYEKWLAEDLAQATSGIDTVTNNIKVNPDVVVVTLYEPASTYAQHVRNATTSTRVNSLLIWNKYTDGLDIDVSTHDGTVTLTGVADTKKAKQRAGKIAAGTLGVTSVDNQLTVGNANVNKPEKSLSDKTIANRLQASYLYSFHVDAADLKVKVDNGKATLSGDVTSDFERERAIAIAQHTYGVKAVDASGIDVVDSSAMQTTG